MNSYESFSWRKSHHTKAEFLFQNLSTDMANALKMDDIAQFSTTDAKTADNIVKFILKIIPKSASIIDATACIGGSAFAFANTFQEVRAIELDPVRYQHLVDNKELLKMQNLECICGDALELIPRIERSDLIFIDPPWGGPVYKTEPSVYLSLSGIPIHEVCDHLAPYTKYIALKVPTNFDSDKLLATIKNCVLYAKNTTLRKMHLIILSSIMSTCVG
jgi:hypothetical protein